MAFDAERLKVFEQLKVVRAVCADPVSLNSQKRDAMQDLIEALGPPEPLRKPPIKGMQRVTIDAVEAIGDVARGRGRRARRIEEEPEAEAPRRRTRAHKQWQRSWLKSKSVPLKPSAVRNRLPHAT